MSESRPAAPVPERPTVRKLQEAVEGCRACDLWEGATQAVMGEGARGMRMSSWSESNPATARTGKVTRSWAPRGASLTGVSNKPE